MKKVERVFEVVTVIYRLLINKILGKNPFYFLECLPMAMLGILL